MQSPAQIQRIILRTLWEQDINQRPGLVRILIYLGRMIWGIARKFLDGDFNMRAMSLVYTTLLSIVPLAAISFSVLRGFGIHNQLEPALLEFLAPLGDRRIEIVSQIVAFVENLRLGVLSTLGMVMLIYTIIAMTHKVESAFNVIWHVSKPRSLARRFADYLSVILVGPVIVFSGVSLSRTVLHSSLVQWLASVEPFGTLLYGVSLLVPYLLICGGFAFLYGFVPNTRVKFSAAILGGVFSGLLWSAASVIFANLVANSSNYSAIYAGFAGAVLFMVWIYIGWLIILVGGQVAFYWQNPRFLDPRTEKAVLTSREAEEVALELMTLIGRAHYRHEPLWTFSSLEQHRQDLQPDILLRELRRLEARGLIITTSTQPPSYLPARDVSNIQVSEILQMVRGRDQTEMPSLPSVAALMDKVDAAISETVGTLSLKDLIERAEAGEQFA
ncbi:MAG: YihY/virulence factor BrkB family protein [Gammaproteobacteria bacterium]